MYNPNQFNPYYQPPNPYQMQPTQMPVAKPQGLMGEMITDYETVKTARVDMSGRVSYYPTLDGKSVFSKALMPDGTARICQYELKVADMSENKSESADNLIQTLAAIKETVDSLADRFNTMWGGAEENE